MEYNIKTNGTASDFYRIGEEFRLAAYRCYGEDENGTINLIKDGKIHILSSAAVVNSAFACEVFFKSILKYKNIGFPKKHDLDKLYEKLPMDIQEGVALFCGNTNVIEFKAVLEKHSKDFIDARYYVEHSGWYGMSPTFMITLAYNLSQITKAYLNNWDIHRALEKMRAN